MFVAPVYTVSKSSPYANSVGGDALVQFGAARGGSLAHLMGQYVNNYVPKAMYDSCVLVLFYS